MVSLGEKLRAARERRKVGVYEAALETHIRSVIIEALEAGEYSKLPPLPFTRGLLRNYATYLGLDPQVVFDELVAEMAQKQAPLPPPTSPPEAYTPPSTFAPGPNSLEPPPFFTSLPRPLATPPRPDAQIPSPSARSTLQIHETRPYVADLPETIFEVAPEMADEGALGNPSEARTWTHRVSSTKLPEIVAAVALGIALLAIAIFAYGRLFPSSSSQALLPPAAARSTQTPTGATSKAPTRVPTLAETPSNEARLAMALTPTAPTAKESTSSAPADAQMTLQVEASAAMWVWVVADDVEVFKAELKGETRTWTAHHRLYVQIKNLPNGTVLFQGKQILARVFAERQVLERAWAMDEAGVPKPAEAATFLTPPAPTATPSYTPTATATFTNTPTPTFTATATSTPSPTPTFTVTPTLAPSATPSITPTPLFRVSPTAPAVPTVVSTPACVPRPGVPC